MINRNRFGVSGMFAKVIHWKEERKNDELAKILLTEQTAWEEALREETLKEFGEVQPETQIPSGSQKPSQLSSLLTWGNAGTFLISILLGGTISSFFRGTAHLTLKLNADYVKMRGLDWQPWALLLLGGLLIGFGARMAGGCTSGHGLSGCSRLSVASFLATAGFFGTAILFSLLLGGKLG
jgi:uncharacterized protein